jgi:hypothetical protein
MKKIKITYWITTGLIVFVMLSSGVGYLIKLPHFVEMLKELGYPNYFLYILGVSKLLGVYALLQNKYFTIKEWAYAGFSFLLISATISHAVYLQYDHAPLSIVWLIVLGLSYKSNQKINSLSEKKL